jgi:hypothetical protein
MCHYSRKNISKFQISSNIEFMNIIQFQQVPQFLYIMVIFLHTTYDSNYEELLNTSILYISTTTSLFA